MAFKTKSLARASLPTGLSAMAVVAAGVSAPLGAAKVVGTSASCVASRQAANARTQFLKPLDVAFPAIFSVEFMGIGLRRRAIGCAANDNISDGNISGRRYRTSSMTHVW